MFNFLKKFKTEDFLGFNSFNYKKVDVYEFAKDLINGYSYKDECIELVREVEEDYPGTLSHTSLLEYIKRRTDSCKFIKREITNVYNDKFTFLDLSNIKALKVRMSPKVSYNLIQRCILPDYVYIETSNWNGISIHSSKIKNIKIVYNFEKGNDLTHNFWCWDFKKDVKKINIEIGLNLNKSIERTKIRYCNSYEGLGKNLTQNELYKTIRGRIGFNDWGKNIENIEMNLTTNLTKNNLDELDFFNEIKPKKLNLIYDDYAEYYI